MAFTETGATLVHGTTVSTTAEAVELTGGVRQVAVTNRDGTNTVYVTVAVGALGTSSAAMEALVVTAVAAADNTFVIPPNARKIVFKSAAPRLVACPSSATPAPTRSRALSGTTDSVATLCAVSTPADRAHLTDG